MQELKFATWMFSMLLNLILKQEYAMERTKRFQ